MRLLIAVLVAFGVSTAIFTGAAFAAQDSTVTVDNTPIFAEPRTNAKIIEYLQMGIEVRISSFPMSGGWYKVRSRTGIYGWVNEKNLSVFKPDAKAPKVEGKDIYRPERDRKWYVRGLGGFDFFRPDDINSLFDFDDLNTGRTLGGEVGVFISERVALGFRTEALAKDVTAKERNSQLFFNLSLRSYPVMGGLDFYLMKLPAMRLSVGIFGGVAFATSFASEASSLPEPNTVVLQRNPFTSLIRMNVTRPLGRIISVFGEVGYRYLRTEDIDTTQARDILGGTEIYARDGVFRNRVIDLSGVVLSVGVGVHF